jgi:pimeloyl-ACP methyl ester carboxylesterase
MNEGKYRIAETTLWRSNGCEPSERFISLHTTGTRVRVQEVGEGEPVLFIHGGPNAGSTWAPLVANLDGFRCLLLDRPGTGLSEPYPVTAGNLDEFGARIVGEVLDGLGIERAHMVASSFGGHLALRSAAARPERFRRMVQMAAPATCPGQIFPSFMKSLESPMARTMMRIMPPSRRINLNIMRQIGHGASLDAGRIPDVFFDWYLALGRYTDTMRNDARMIGAEILPNLDALTLSPSLLGSVTTPTLFLWGADDGFGGEGNAREVAAMMPDADLVMMPEAGHLPWLDDPRFTAARTREFLTMSDQTSAGEPRTRVR